MPKERLLPYIILGLSNILHRLLGRLLRNNLTMRLANFGVLLIVRFTLN